LHIFWWGALNYASDGSLSALNDEEIAILAGWDGEAAVFVGALHRADFIDKVDDGYIIHDWGDYAGRLVDGRERKREQDRERSKSYRDRQKQQHHATVTHDDNSRHAAVTQVEKSREDKSRVEKLSGADAPKKASPKFTPPTLDEVRVYCQARGSNVDPVRFYDYFNTSGWVDSKGNKVRNWKQKIITWEASNNAIHKDIVPTPTNAAGDTATHRPKYGAVI